MVTILPKIILENKTGLKRNKKYKYCSITTCHTDANLSYENASGYQIWSEVMTKAYLTARFKCHSRVSLSWLEDNLLEISYGHQICFEEPLTRVQCIAVVKCHAGVIQGQQEETLFRNDHMVPNLVERTSYKSIILWWGQ